MVTATKQKRQTKAAKYGRKPQRKEFKQSQTRQLMADLETLSNEIVTDTDKLAEFVKLWQGGFYDYSFQNTLLILSQRRDATLCAGYQQWQAKHKRQVNKGEKGISILVPIFHKVTVKAEDGSDDMQEAFSHRFTTGYVWDIKQTDGEDVVLGAEQYVNGHSSITLDAFIKLYPEYQTTIDGKSAHSQGSTDGQRINLALAKTEKMVAVYAHELGHIEAGHANGRKNKDGTPLSRELKELEAEAISYLVCCYLGIENDKSKHYIGNWHGTPETLGKSGKVILSTAYNIIKRIRSAS